MDNTTWIFGEGIGSSTGTSLFEQLIPILHALPALFAAMAISAIALHIVCYFTDFSTTEALANLIQTIKRILIIGSFVALLGSIVSWILLGTGASPAGSAVVTGL